MKKTNAIIISLLLITMASVGITIWSLFFRVNEDIILAPDYAPIKLEENAERISNDQYKPIESKQGGGSVSLSYSTNITIDLSDATAKLYFANPGKSNHDMVLQLSIQDRVIFQSGRLLSGHQLNKINLSETATSMLQPGGYDGYFQVFYYDQESAEKAIINTEIPVSIQVKE